MIAPDTPAALDQAARTHFRTTLAPELAVRANSGALRAAPDQVPYRLRPGPQEDTLILRRSDWTKVEPLLIETSRLTIRPMTPEDGDAFHRIAGQLSVARMLVNLDHPLTREAADHWMARRQYRGRVGFMVGIYDRTDALVGAIGLGGLSNALVYFLHEDTRGQGIGTEAVSAFVADAAARFALTSIFAGVFTDNPGSRRLLERLGFTVTGTIPYRSPARPADAPIWEMLWTRPDPVT